MIYACMLGAVCGASAFWAYLLVAWLSGNFALGAVLRHSRRAGTIGVGYCSVFSVNTAKP